MTIIKGVFKLMKLGVAGLATASISISSQALTTATIDLKTEKYIGGVSSLDRSKYFNIHMTSSENQMTNTELNHLVNDLNVNFGRQFWSPFSAYNGNAPYPSESNAIAAGPGAIASTKNHASYPYYSNRLIVTDHPGNIFVAGEDPALAAEWAVNYFKHYYDNTTRPLFYEPMNEPFVHAGDFGSDQAAIRLQMTNVFKAIGQKFTQQNVNTKIIGYSSAWPSMELWDFDHFNGRMKQFMDVAGPHIDSFSFHPYDGVNVTGANNERSGSNLESLLDMVETYSQFKFGQVKPITISEYGGIESGYGTTYTDLRSAQSLLSQNKMVMQLLNRQDRLLTSIPFNTGKSAWHYNAGNNWNPYGAAVLRPDPNSIVNGQPTNFFWTKRLDFYRLWADVKGKRVKVESSNPDIQINAFVSANKAYVAINTLADYNDTVNLDFVNSLGTVNSVRQKRMIVHKNAAPVYTDGTVSTPSSHTFVPGETIVWEYTFANNVTFSERLDSDHYYAPEHLINITANQAKTFTFNGVNVAQGKSVIRMSLGRAHGNSLQPTVSVNGNTVLVNSNWGGGDQATRDSFFGVVDIPVDNSILSTNNMVSVTFPDAGGRIASMVLQVNNDSGAGNGAAIDDVSIPQPVTSLPSQISYSIPVNYAATVSRDVTVEIWQNNTYLDGNKATVSPGTGTVNIGLTLATAPLAGATGYLLKYAIRPVGTNWTQNIDTAQSGNITISAQALSPPLVDTQLTFKSSNKCMDVTGGGLSDGIKLQQWACYANNNNQLFLFEDRGAGWWGVKNKTSGKCIDKTNSLADGAVLHQWACSATNDNQSFKIVDQGQGYFQLQNKHSNKCVNIVGGIAGTANGTQLEQSTCAAVDSQLLKF